MKACPFASWPPQCGRSGTLHSRCGAPMYSVWTCVEYTWWHDEPSPRRFGSSPASAGQEFAKASPYARADEDDLSDEALFRAATSHAESAVRGVVL